MALEGSNRPLMRPSILLVYATTEGQTAKITAELAMTLRSRNITVTRVNAARQPMCDPSPYSAVIVAASVHAERFQRSIRRWVRRYQTVLASRPNVLLGVCLAVVNRSPDVDKEIQAVLDRFVRDTGWRPAEIKIVAGALKYTQYGWLKRWMMRRIVAKHGGDVDVSRDYEYTDWDDVRAFADRFAGRVLESMTEGVGETAAVPALVH
jgi:menaquinone-dependent protoporphyrinogen oxidase